MNVLQVYLNDRPVNAITDLAKLYQKNVTSAARFPLLIIRKHPKLYWSQISSNSNLRISNFGTQLNDPHRIRYYEHYLTEWQVSWRLQINAYFLGT